MRSFVLSNKNIKKNWFVIDATDIILGRAATQIASMLIGKHKADYTPFLDAGDNIIIINAPITLNNAMIITSVNMR